MKKLLVALGAVVLAVAGLTSCSVSEADGKAWAEANGYFNTITEDAGKAWAAEHGYVEYKELPAARLDAAAAVEYSTTNSGVQLVPADGSAAKKAADYLGRNDIVYIDARDIGNYLNGHVEGFECLPYFDLVAGTGLLFTVDGDTVTANYEESVATMKKLLPEGKVMFLMCQSGGRIVNFMKVLKFCGYDMTKIYNIGGWNDVKTGDHAGYRVTTGNLMTAGNNKFVVDFSGLTKVAA